MEISIHSESGMAMTITAFAELALKDDMPSRLSGQVH
jgi:hypothetical protein